MEISHAPRVTLVAITKFSAPPEIAAMWTSDTDTDCQLLIEFAGRMCYQSWDNPAKRTNAAYIGNMLEQGHLSVIEHASATFFISDVSRSLTHELVRHRHLSFCLTGDTLIYSDIYHRNVFLESGARKRRGPTKHRLDKLYEYTKTPKGLVDLRKVRVRCLDEATGTFTPGRINTVVCSGVMPVFRVELADGKSITCSKDHRLLTQEGWRRLEEIVGGLRVSPGGHALYGHLNTPIQVNGVPIYQDRTWLEEQYITRGLDQQTIGEIVGVSSHTIRKWIRHHGLQKPLGSWTQGVEPWNKGKRYKPGWQHTEENRRRFSELKRGEGNPQWRGGITPKGIQIRRGVEDLRTQILERDSYRCRLCGCQGGCLTMHHILPVWARPELVIDADNIATLCRRCHLQVNQHELEYVERLGRNLQEIPVDAKCPSPRGHLVVPRPRRIKSITYAGEQLTYDLEMEHPHHSFVANGIVTHNSQISQRYVPHTDANFIEPEPIAADPELHALFLGTVQTCQAAYDKLLQKLTERFADVEDRTLRRKLARQAARCVMPNATETKIVVTGNFRAWRWFVHMRGSEHADREIRALAIAILRELQREAPAVFGDYEIVSLPDGSEAATSKYPY